MTSMIRSLATRFQPGPTACRGPAAAEFDDLVTRLRRQPDPAQIAGSGAGPAEITDGPGVRGGTRPVSSRWRERSGSRGGVSSVGERPAAGGAQVQFGVALAGGL